MLRSNNKSVGIASLPLETLKLHQDFKDTDRVCFARVNSSSRQLTVIESATFLVAGENLMKSGYSCFVRPESSLFQLKE